MKIKNIFKIDPLKSFIELPILWLMVTILFSIAIIIAFIIYSNSNIDYRLDYIGINSLVEIFKIPLSILAIIITFIAILATTHRSVQTREQILTTTKQNSFSNYYKHIDEFEKYITTSIPNKTTHFHNFRFTYKYLFPNSFEGDYSTNKEFLNIIEQEFSKCISLLKYFNKDEHAPPFNIFYEVHLIIDTVFDFIFCKIDRSGRQIVEEGKKIVVPDLNIKNAFLDIKKVSSILVQIISFDHYIIIPDSLNQLANLDISTIPDWNFLSGTPIEKLNILLIKKTLTP